jgi:predicted GTPase
MAGFIFSSLLLYNGRMNPKSTTKLYCYVDETGQDTEGEFFLVSVVVTESDRERLRQQLESIEKTSGKGQRKWIRVRHNQRVAYIREVLKIPALKGRLNYAIHRHTTDYLPRAILTTARAITLHATDDYQAVVFVDGLRKSQTKWFGAELRHLRVRTAKVRGVRREEADALMRLADAIAGFVRAAISGKGELASLLKKAQREGFIKEL